MFPGISKKSITFLMESHRNITDRAIEGLYNEALLLADQARRTFAQCENAQDIILSNEARIALSVEGLKTMTRVMNIITWILSHKAFLSGELTARQLQQHGALDEERLSDATNLILLPAQICFLIRDTENLYTRIARLDQERCIGGNLAGNPVGSLQNRITQIFEGN